MAFLIILILFILFAIAFILKGVVIVRQAETLVIERLGRYHTTLDSGINVILPIFDQAREIEWRYVVEGGDIRKIRTKRIDLRETVYDFPKQNVITRDNVLVELNALLYFQITNPIRAIYEIANLPDAIEKLTQTTLRNIIGELALDETLASRDTINQRMRAILDEATDKWGVKVNRVELQDINPPQEIRGALEKQMRAERDRRAAILEAEGIKQSNILQSEGFRDAEINRAEGDKRAKILAAEGQAEARIKVAHAEAEAINQVTKAITASKGDPANYLIAVRYIEALKEMVTGQGNKVVYIPYEATGVLSSIGGIKEMLDVHRTSSRASPPVPPH